MKKYTKIEEIINGVTHGIGVVFGIVALTILLIFSIRKGDVSATVSFSIYGACIILMFLSSTLYHSFTKEKVKNVLRVFDHSSIFLFIAGTYTPIVILTLKGYLRMGILIGIWAMAISGVVFKILTYGKFDKYKLLSLIFYIGMGWVAIIPIKKIIEATSINFFYWILLGGVIYTLGTIFYSIKKIPYNHAIWHLFVLAASVTHFVGIFLYLT
ncbi:hemolysin-III related [Tissierella creatinophila DSM 6911]|uniref:Hemolysin-III related n=2 Tax=Tissierella creatinophila TaxID=79681 RepID=A0A1U7M419_TISCR|nr:hemolysin-III related [Tissierella creatinophila DSM 6911]